MWRNGQRQDGPKAARGRVPWLPTPSPEVARRRILEPSGCAWDGFGAPMHARGAQKCTMWRNGRQQDGRHLPAGASRDLSSVPGGCPALHGWQRGVLWDALARSGTLWDAGGLRVQRSHSTAGGAGFRVVSIYGSLPATSLDHGGHHHSKPAGSLVSRSAPLGHASARILDGRACFCLGFRV